ncbi:MAG TPA: hypothetical protein VF933_27030 [Streptosporangiaceae bacterium]
MLTQRQKTLDELAEAVAAALGELDPAGQRLAIALYRLLAAGRPVAAADLARATGLPQPEVAETLGRWPAVFTDGQGRVTGFWAWRSASCLRRTGTSPAGRSCMRGAPGTLCSCPPGSGRRRT